MHEREAESIEHASRLSRTRYFWIVNYLVDYTGWDFLWEPPPWQSHQRHAWPSQWQKDSGTYLIPKSGYQDTNYHTTPALTRLPCQDNWHVPEIADVASFDWSWHPDPTDPLFIYQFGTQHQRTGGPRYVMSGATEVKYVDQIRIKTNRTAAAAYLIDHHDGRAANVAAVISQHTPLIKTVRYVDNYFDTLKRLAASVPDDQEWIWICSTVCEYDRFDFSWHPEQWQAGMLHVFASNDQKFGDTFFMHVPSFRSRCRGVELLEWIDIINFVPQRAVSRPPPPVVIYHSDSVVDAVKHTEFTAPVLHFVTDPDLVPEHVPTLNLWREKTKTVIPLSMGASSVLIPRECKNYVKEQVYDYPWIDKTHNHVVVDPLCDVIFLSTQEPMAEVNWQNLKSICSRARRSGNVRGREASTKAAAASCDSKWFYCVFAKTEVLPDFAFTFQPDRLQAPKHYIFHSRNPLNGLEYGAMNINLYNRQLVLDTQPGLDFTLSSRHEVVPILASISRFNTDPWVTWRSAFREALKLRLEVDRGADVEIQHRLHTWLTQARGENAEHCIAGCQDGIRFYESVNGDYEKLRQSFDWDWLEQHYYDLYQERPWEPTSRDR